MILPWNTVYYERHLSREDEWIKAEAPFTDFFEEKVKHLLFSTKPAPTYLTFTKKYRIPKWREWFIGIVGEAEPYVTCATLRSRDFIHYRFADGREKTAKSISVDLHPYEARVCEETNFRLIPNPLLMRLRHGLGH